MKDRPDLKKQRPFLSGNDRSRWNTMRSLVEHGTYAIDDIVAEPNWDTIDMVKHADAEGNQHLYSSKPPLLATLYAIPYWIVYQTSGVTLGTHPYEIGRPLLILFNVVPLVFYFWLLARMLERYGRSDWGRIFIMAVACFATFLSTFVTVVNNHEPGAIAALATIYFAARIWYDQRTEWRYFFLAGAFAAFAATCELPALSLFGLVGVGLLWNYPQQTLIAGVPGVLLVAIPFFATNWIAHASLRMPYAHRSDGEELLVVDSKPEAVAELDAGQIPDALQQALAAENILLSPESKIRTKHEDNDRVDPKRWVIEDNSKNVWYSVKRVSAADSSEPKLAVHAWDDWYDYDYVRKSDGRLIDSYWRKPNGIDVGEPSAGIYVIHCLIGHHGIFSLTPIWLLIIPGVFLMARSKDYQLPALAGLIAVLTIVCLSFYLSRPQIDRNYGGMTSGFRWVFWFTPLWLLAALPAADWMSKARWSRGLAIVLLGLSVMSVAYPTWNPWVLPWMHNFWIYMGWGTL